MPDYYAVDVTIRFGVLADSHETAEAAAKLFAPLDEIGLPDGARVSYDAMRTLNQTDSIKARAVNAE